MKRRRKIPHLFAKLVVIWCIAFASGASYYALRILTRTGNDAAGLLAVILGFFGGELLFLCLRTVLKERTTRKDAAASGKETDDGNSL